MHDEFGEARRRLPGARSVVIGSTAFFGGFLAFVCGVDAAATAFHVPVPPLLAATGARSDETAPAASLDANSTAEPRPVPPAATSFPSVPPVVAPAAPQRTVSPIPAAAPPKPVTTAIVFRPQAAPSATPHVCKVPHLVVTGAASESVPGHNAPPIARRVQHEHAGAGTPLLVTRVAGVLAAPAHAGLPNDAALDPRQRGPQSLLIDPGAAATPPPDAVLPRNP